MSPDFRVLSKAQMTSTQNGKQGKIYNPNRQDTCYLFGLVGGKVQNMQKRNDERTILVQHEVYKKAVVQELPKPGKLY
jgi:hypothetical protein